MKSTIISFETACAYQGMQPVLPDVSMLPAALGKSILAHIMLVIIAGALNREANGGKPWVPKYDGSEVHYWPWFYRGDNSGSGFRFYYYFAYYRYSSVGSRLEYISEEVAAYAGETFVDLYRDAHTIEEPSSVEEPASE